MQPLSPSMQWNTALRRKHPARCSNTQISVIDQYQHNYGFKTFSMVRRVSSKAWYEYHNGCAGTQDKARVQVSGGNTETGAVSIIKHRCIRVRIQCIRHMHTMRTHSHTHRRTHIYTLAHTPWPHTNTHRRTQVCTDNR